MRKFTSASDFSEFARIVKSEYRYVRTEETQRFLDAVLNSAKSREQGIPKGFIFWRAQLGSDTRQVEQGGEKFEQDTPHPPKRTIPSPEFAHDGRANPKGIPYLYAATDKVTAMAEVRPWVSALVSVACFQLSRDITIVDCSKFHAERAFCKLLDRNVDDMDRPLTNDEINKAVWIDIDHSYSRPINRSDEDIEYIPTQIISELFRNNGYDGVVYKSMLTDEGFNIVLFDKGVASQVAGQLFQLEVIKHKFSDCPIDEYFCRAVSPSWFDRLIARLHCKK